jgi:2-keto-4-pentenoate hydratase
MSVWARDDLGEAFRRQLEQRAGREADGDRPIGWKLGFGTPQALQSLAIDAPLVGSLFASGVLPSGGSVAIGSWSAPRIETEIAVHLGADVPAGADRAARAAAVRGLSLAFELVDFAGPTDDPCAILESNVYQRHVVLGPVQALDAVPGVTIVVDDDEVAADADPQAAVGDVLDLVGHVAEVAEGFGAALAAGDVVITGAAIPALTPEPGQRHRARASQLGEIEISFTA